MKLFSKNAVAMMAIAVATMSTASADWPGLGYFGPYGNTGLRVGTRVPNPPYFAMHPPVYYGNRHTRPYGISPYAALPEVQIPSTYKGRLASKFYTLPSTPVRAIPQINPLCEQCDNAHAVSSRRGGIVRTNPFVENSTTQFASDI